MHYPDGTTVLTNNNWRETQEGEILLTGLAPDNNFESAILATLEPGNYTAIVRGFNDGTRGLIETADNVMIGGVIVGPDSAPSGSIRFSSPAAPPSFLFGLAHERTLSPLVYPSFEP